jgi:peptidylprolyl isomerase
MTNMTLSRPTIDFPEGAPPAELEITDLVIGDGDEATPGRTVAVHYLGVTFQGEEFDASWNRGSPFQFQLGAGRVIAGWDQGVAGMRVGGRRKLVIPPHLAYGNRGAGGVIKPGDTLIFVVDLLKVH